MPVARAQQIDQQKKMLDNEIIRQIQRKMIADKFQ